MATQKETAAELLDRHGRTFADEAGITLHDKPQPLFELLVLTSLLSARIDAGIATDSASCIFKAGWRSPEQLRDASDDELIRVLTEGGYTRYRERATSQLHDLAAEVLDRWDGDLRTLREDAGGDADALRGRLEDFKGIGPAGVEIFAREAQGVWPELAPTFDGPATSGAERAGLPQDAEKLAQLVDADDLPRLAAALVRTDLEA